MNKMVMVVWGLVIVSMFFLILMIGYKKQDREYIDFSKELKAAGKQYIKDNRISIKLGDSMIIYINDLIEGQYIKEDKRIKDYCVEGIIYSNELLIDSYKIKENCIHEETKE